MRLNRDIFIRTVLLVSSFTWFTRLGSLQGDVVLAANGILYQIFHVAVYALDGFAIAAESLVGQAAGARNRQLLRRSALVSTVAAFGLAVGFAAAALPAAPAADPRSSPTCRRCAPSPTTYFFWAALMPIVGVFAYQFDGVFMGATEGPAMRNAMIVSARPLSGAQRLAGRALRQ